MNEKKEYSNEKKGGMKTGDEMKIKNFVTEMKEGRKKSLKIKSRWEEKKQWKHCGECQSIGFARYINVRLY